MEFFDDLGLQAASPLHSHVKIVDLKPQQDTVPRRRRICVDEVWVILHVPRMQLKKQPTSVRDPIVHIAMGVFGNRVCSKQFDVPATARPNIAYCDEWLRLDR